MARGGRFEEAGAITVIHPTTAVGNEAIEVESETVTKIKPAEYTVGAEIRVAVMTEVEAIENATKTQTAQAISANVGGHQSAGRSGRGCLKHPSPP